MCSLVLRNPHPAPQLPTDLRAAPLHKHLADVLTALPSPFLTWQTPQRAGPGAGPSVHPPRTLKSWSPLGHLLSPSLSSHTR